MPRQVSTAFKRFLIFPGDLINMTQAISILPYESELLHTCYYKNYSSFPVLQIAGQTPGAFIIST
jgi:hypothetical protein